MLNIFVSIVNYNGKKNTLACLSYLNELKIEGFNLEVVVIDNASKEIFNVSKDDYNNFNFYDAVIALTFLQRIYFCRQRV